jgi:hypothetical protein
VVGWLLERRNFLYSAVRMQMYGSRRTFGSGLLAPPADHAAGISLRHRPLKELVGLTDDGAE